MGEHRATNFWQFLHRVSFPGAPSVFCFSCAPAFDSQNNNRGGYNVPDATNNPYGTNASLQYYLVSLKHTNKIQIYQFNSVII